MKTAWNLWNSGMKNTLYIADKLSISNRTVVEYFKKGMISKVCNYNHKEEVIKKAILNIKFYYKKN